MSNSISRKGVSAWLYNMGHHKLADAVMDENRFLSEDRPQGEWITCSEREPNEFEDVLVLLSDGTMDVLQITDYLDIWGNVKWCHAVNYGMGYAVGNNDVVAWMPLPEPWKGAKNNKECHKPQSLYYRAFCEEREDSVYCDGCEFWY